MFGNLFRIRGAGRITKIAKRVMRSHMAINVSFSFFCLLNVCLMSVFFACSYGADGAEQEESASLCEYVLQFEVKFEFSN